MKYDPGPKKLMAVPRILSFAYMCLLTYLRSSIKRLFFVKFAGCAEA